MFDAVGADISITKRYVHPEDETVKAAMERVAAEHETPHKIPHTALEAHMTAAITAAAIN